MTGESGESRPLVAVVIPCYRVGGTVLQVIERVGPEVGLIVCVDDACPERSGDLVASRYGTDPRIRIIRNVRNRGVGAATCAGYRASIAAGARIIVKIDGDGQMDPRLIPYFAAPIQRGEADYVKGNRFFAIETLKSMPWRRIVGNAVLSFFSKLSSGYWNLFDPANGFTAIEAEVASQLPLDKLHPRFFFESDLLFRLATIRARVVELPIASSYFGQASNLSEAWALLTFPFLHFRNFVKRLLYCYFLRGFSLASINLVLGVILFAFGLLFGLDRWAEVSAVGIAASPGTVMLAALPILVGLQLILAFVSHDMAMVPTVAVHPNLHQIQVLYRESATADRSATEPK
jgi:glycosyltransferase involved in cell wall biosynthesis